MAWDYWNWNRFVNNCNNQSLKPDKINITCDFVDGNLTERIDELEERIILLEHWKNLVSDQVNIAIIKLEEIFIFKDEVEEKLSVNQTRNYFKYLSGLNRKKLVCGYAQDKGLEHIEDLELSCDLTYKILTSGRESVTCRCKNL